MQIGDRVKLDYEAHLKMQHKQVCKTPKGFRSSNHSNSPKGSVAGSGIKHLFDSCYVPPQHNFRVV